MKDQDSLSILNIEDNNTLARQANKDEGKYPDKYITPSFNTSKHLVYCRIKDNGGKTPGRALGEQYIKRGVY